MNYSWMSLVKDFHHSDGFEEGYPPKLNTNQPPRLFVMSLCWKRSRLCGYSIPPSVRHWRADGTGCSWIFSTWWEDDEKIHLLQMAGILRVRQHRGGRQGTKAMEVTVTSGWDANTVQPLQVKQGFCVGKHSTQWWHTWVLYLYSV